MLSFYVKRTEQWLFDVCVHACMLEGNVGRAGGEAILP